MQSLNWYLLRLKSMSPAEIAWRVRGLLREQTDILRFPLGIFPRIPSSSLARLPDFTPGYSPSPIATNDPRYAECENAAAWRAALLEKADLLLKNRMSYFDLEALDHGDPVAWHRDHSAGIDSPVRLCAFTDYRDFATYGDCKLVWEPNRHHQLVVLARAWSVTGNARYAEKIAELLQSWLDANPFGYGMNWKSPLELGVRIINWVWALDLIRDAAVIDDELWQRVQQATYQAMWDGQRKFSRGSSANNHLIGEAAGVFVGACYFNTFPNADSWARKSQVVLEREIQAQTYADGGTREHAFGYQFFVIQFFSLCLQAGEAAGHPFSEAFKRRLHDMYKFLHELVLDTGAPPNSGDRDDGYVLDLGDLPDNAAALLAVGAELFADPSLSDTPSETVFWMTGKPQCSPAQGHREPGSRSFPASGYHILRSARIGVFIDCADLGYGPIAAHGHADCLSICAALDGLPMIVDAGTYDYFTHPEWRNYFRETRAHNTVEIDGQSQSEMLGPFLWGKRATPELLDWQDDDADTTFAGRHDGYCELEDPVDHQRRLRLDKASHALTIVDTLACNGRHTARLHFHLHPDCKVEQRSASEILVSRDDSTLVLSTSAANFECLLATDESMLGWISPSYHRRLPSTCIRLTVEIEGDTSIECLLQPA